MATTTINLRRGVTTNSEYQSDITSYINPITNEYAISTVLFHNCEPWVNKKNRQMWIDGLCVNPYLPGSTNTIRNEYVNDERSSQGNERILLKSEVILKPNGGILADVNGQGLYIDGSYLTHLTDYFTTSVDGIVHCYDDNHSDLQNLSKDRFWLSHKNTWHQFNALQITDNYFHNIMFYPYIRDNNDTVITVSSSFNITPVSSNVLGGTINLKQATTTLLGGVKLSCPNNLTVTQPDFFGNTYYPIGMNNTTEQIFAIASKATPVNFGVVTRSGTNKRNDVVGDTIISKATIGDSDILVAELDACKNCITYSVDGKNVFKFLQIVCGLKTPYTEHYIILDNTESGKDLVFDNIEIIDRDGREFDCHFPYNSSITIPPLTWMKITILLATNPTETQFKAYVTYNYDTIS